MRRLHFLQVQHWQRIERSSSRARGTFDGSILKFFVLAAAGAALAEGSKVVFPRSLHASFAGSILNSPHLRALLWLLAITATAAWLASAAAAAGLAAGSSRQFAASSSGSVAPAMSRNPSLRSLGLQRFPSMPALSGLLKFKDAGGSGGSFPGSFTGSGCSSQQSYAAASSTQPPATTEPFYKAAKGNGSRMSSDGGRLPPGSFGGSGGSLGTDGVAGSGGSLWADPAAAGGASHMAAGDWGPRMSPPPTPHGDGGGGGSAVGSGHIGSAQQQRQLGGASNGGGWAGGRTGPKRRGLR